MLAVRVAELSRQTGVPVPTIKYYLREGLLPRGEPTHQNQADYGDEHARRLRLIRALIDLGGLSVAATREVLADVDGPATDLDRRLGHVVGSIGRPTIELDATERAVAEQQVAALVETHGWSDGDPDYPARRGLEEVLATLGRLGATSLLANLDRYAEIADRIAVLDLDTIAELGDGDTVLEQAVVTTVLGDALIASLRRVAQAAESGRRFGAGVDRRAVGATDTT